MEQITRRDGRIYYGETECASWDCAYRLFRDDYHSSIGRIAWYRLNRLGSRIDRKRGFYTTYDDKCSEGEGVHEPTSVCSLVGMLDISYCWAYDVPEMDDEFFWESWLPAATRRGSGILSFRRAKGVGRTAKKRRDMRKQYIY